MDTFSTWALRIEAGTDGQPLSDEQIANWQRWGVLREPPDARWSIHDVERAREIQELGKEVRSLPRRAVRLFNLNYPTPPGKLREAMIAVANTTSAPVRKMRCIGTASSLLYEGGTSRHMSRRSRSQAWRIPPSQWEQILNRFSDYEFRLIAGSAISQATALSLNPTVTRSTILDGIPFEELIVLLTVRQLAIGDEIKTGLSLPY